MLVSMPMGPNAGPYVAEAVASVLAQTHDDVILVVTSDGQGPDAWMPLEDVDDPRLVRFDLPENRGRYFADAVTVEVVRRNPDRWDWWTLHDADDTSGPGRFEAMLAAADDDTQVVLAGFTIASLRGRPDIVRQPNPGRVTKPGARVAHVAHHTALFRPSALETVRPNPDWRVAFDTLLIALAVRHLDVAVCTDTSYRHRLHDGQITRDPEWGMRGRERTMAWRRRERLWRQATTKTGSSKACTGTDATETEVREHADRLEAVLS